METFLKWLERFNEVDGGAGSGAVASHTSATTSGNIGVLPMRLLSYNGRGYFGVPGGPLPVDKKNRPPRRTGRPSGS